MLTSRRHASSAEVHGKVGDDQHAKWLGDLAGLGVVLFDRLVLIAQILLNHRLHVSSHVGEPLLDLLLLGPDPRADELLVVVGQVHEGREVLAQADGIDDGEAKLARRNGGQQPKHDGLDGLNCSGAALFAGLEQQRATIRERQECGHAHLHGQGRGLAVLV